MTEKGGEPKALSFDKDEVTIGRVSGNDIVLPKGNVSKRHSRITLKDGHVEIADLKSTNGTYVNGKKILDATVLVATDRVYVGDFLITIDGLGGEVVAPRRAPPPPPPPRAHGSSSAKLPTLDERTNTGDAGPPPDDDDDELGLAAKPPRAGRVPPPPPPPPRRPPTPIATKPLSDDDDDLGEIAPPSPAELAAADDSTNNIGLFERRKTADHATFEGDRPATGSRPAAVLPPEPLPAPPGQPFAAPAEPAAIATGADGLDGLLGDPSVVQIVIASDAAYADRGAGLTAVAGGLGDPNAVADALWRLANMASPPPSSDNPVVDVRLPDGSRLVAVFPPVSAGGVVGSIRRAPQTEQALVDLIPPGAKDLQTLLDAAVVGQRNVLVTGDAAALPALTTALAALVPSDRRVVSIGGALARGRAGWIELQPAGDPTAIVRVAGSFRAEHLVVGEVVGAEAAELVLSAARGQEGLVFALPARSIAEALLRVEALASPAFGGAGAAAPLVASTIDLVVQVVAGTDGAARVVEIAEPKVEGGHVGADTVASWKSDGPKLGSGKLQVTGVSARLAAALSTAGQSLPSSLTRR
ncbi:MAG TPA: FHA domain-containing protein [Polyangia bacterium]|nr:FHA domain-containing protein [Polyangia bacterium]